MSAYSVARSSLVLDVIRYSRTWGLWLILLAGPIGARFMIARDDGSGFQVAIGGHLPILTFATLGASLGIVVSTILLPIGFIYLRSSTTRHRPWQIEEVAAASRVGCSLGRFGADSLVLGGMLTTLTLAGWFLAWLIVTGPLDIIQVTVTLWLIAAPALLGLAALRVLFDSLPILRRGLGELLFFVLWIASLVVPLATTTRPSSFSINMLDFPGFVRPLVGPAPRGNGGLALGSGKILPGRVPVDVMAGLSAPGYIPSRVAWMAIALGVAMLAGVLLRPHTAPKSSHRPGRIARLLAAGPPPAVKPGSPPACMAAFPLAGLFAAEFRLIGAGRRFLVLAILAATVGVIGDYRHIGSPAGLLLLVFGLSAHAGRSEARGLLMLTATAILPPAMRRFAFVGAGATWAIVMALPASVAQISLQPLALALATGSVAGAIAIMLATVSRSSVAPRLVLLVLWYGYLSS